MKKIKIKFVNFGPEFVSEEFFVTRILRKYYDIEITDDPDYVICGGYKFYDYLRYDKIRIMFSGENYIPDFNYIDYAFSAYPVDFLDRHFSFPGLVVPTYEFLEELSRKDRNYSEDILKEKSCFVNLIASHESEKNIRGDMFRLLSQYKRVEAAGPLFNNMPNGARVSRGSSKYELQKKCKFSFCGESVIHEGFITEKIFDAFLADTIPIYIGSSHISTIINKNAYIDIRDYDTLQDVVDKIIELDQDDEKYMEMLRQPVFVDPNYVEKKVADLETFIRNIFDQPLEQAGRRSKFHMPNDYEKMLIEHKKTWDRSFRTVYESTCDKLLDFFWKAFAFASNMKKLFSKKV